MLRKKIIVLSFITAAFLITIGFLIPKNESMDESIVLETTTQTILNKVTMPTKVSRPGCEETDSCYVPSMIAISAGNSVTWINDDVAFHSVTSGFYNVPTGLFDSGFIDPGDIFEVTFDESGTYDYFCTLHPWMKGIVVVDSSL